MVRSLLKIDYDPQPSRHYNVFYVYIDCTEMGQGIGDKCLYFHFPLVARASSIEPLKRIIL
jgi:hypothetical protein